MPVSSPTPRKPAFIAGGFWIVTFVADPASLVIAGPASRRAPCRGH